ncbi:MAG: restriction system protein [Arenicella sp.]|jgi:restriction system protein
MKNNPNQCPTWDEFLRPLLELAAAKPIVRRSAVQIIADKFHFSEEIRSSRIKSGQAHIQNRAGWALSSLVKAKFIEKHSSEKFTYQITDKGRDYLKKHEGPITGQDLKNLEGYEEAWEEASRRKQLAKSDAVEPDTGLEQSTPDDLIERAYNELNQSLADELIESMFVMDPYRFEQLVVDLLFSMGYGGSRSEAAQVTKKSNDEGIDGIINEDRLGLDVIYIQAKRYKRESTIGRKDIQSFVGALAGQQANKGVFITTSGFKKTAVEYAKSVSQKVILIDGDRLATLMIEHNIGVSTVRTVELKRIDSDYFED